MLHGIDDFDHRSGADVVFVMGRNIRYMKDAVGCIEFEPASKQ